MIFNNPEIALEALPKIEEVDYQQLAPAYPRVSYIGNLLFYGVLLALTLSGFYFSEVDDIFYIRFGVLALWFILFLVSMWMVGRSYQIQGYALREKDIIHRKGVIFRSITAIPFNRVQHCEVRQGPIERLFNLKTLEVYTAGGQSSDLSIPGLEGELAQQLKEFIIKRIGQHEQ